MQHQCRHRDISEVGGDVGVLMTAPTLRRRRGTRTATPRVVEPSSEAIILALARRYGRDHISLINNPVERLAKPVE